MFWNFYASRESSGLDYWQAVTFNMVRLVFIREPKRKGSVWTIRGWGETLEVSFCNCGASPQSLLACYVSPHSPLLISREKPALCQWFSTRFVRRLARYFIYL